MAKTLQGMQTNFTAGELSPRLHGHIDISKYQNGLKECTNAYALPHGPVVRRAGTEYIGEVKDSTKEVRLIRFQFNQENAFILEFGHQYIRFFKDGGQILSAAAISNGTFGTDLTGWTDDDTGTGSSTWSAGVMRLAGGAAGVAARTQAVTGIGSAQYTLSFTVATNSCAYRIGTTSGGTEIASGTGGVGSVSVNFTTSATDTIYIQFRNANNNNSDIDNVSLSTPVYQIATSYTEANVQDLTYTQFGRALYIAHGDFPPATLTWNGDADWTLEDVFFYPPPTDEDGYEDVAATLSLSATTGLSVTATAGSGVFLQADVGRQIHNQNGAGKASIVSYTSATVVVVDILEDFPSTSVASGAWKMDLSPIAKLEIDNSSTGTTATVTSYYLDSFRGSAISISSITQAAPGVITTATNHGLTDGDKVELKNINGMSLLNNTIWSVDVTGATTFKILSSTSAAVDTTTYMAYTGGGTMRKVYADLFIDAFRTADEGKYLILNGGVGQIVDVVDAHTAKIEIQKSLNSVASTSSWSLEEEAWTSTKGYPRTVALHQQRLWFGGSDNSPQTVWGSASSIFDSMGTGSLDDDAVQFDLASAEVNQIQWMYGLRDQLVIGTSGAEITLSSGVQSGPITPASAAADSRTYAGSDLQQPISLENEVIYLQRSGSKLNSFRYNYEIDNFLSDDLAFLAEHLPRNGGGIKETAYAQDPDRLIFAVLNDGTMLVGTYYREQQVIAWSLFETDGLIENVQTISTGMSDEVWLVVKRTVNGSDLRYIERMGNLEYDTVEQNTSLFSDCSLALETPLAISAITKANPGVVTTSSNHGLVDGDYVKMFDVGGMTEVIGRTFIVANKTATTFELTDVDGNNVNTSSYTTYTSGGNVYKLFTSVSGLSHLEGLTVQVKADGATHANATVSSGAINLDGRHYSVVVGLPYTTRIVTLNREFNLGIGSQQGQIARHVHPILRVYESAFPTLNDEFLPSRTPSDLMDSRPSFSTGDVEYGALYWDTSTELTLEMDKPFPFMLLGIFGLIEGGQR